MEEVAKQNKDKSYEEFKSLLAKEQRSYKENSIVKATVKEIGKKFIVVDLNLKTESYIPIFEFESLNELKNLEVGKQISVLLERSDTKDGNVICSFERARKKELWEKLESKYNEGKPLSGKLVSKVKSGYAIDLGGFLAFCPNSCLDLYPLKSIDHLKNRELQWEIVKLNRMRQNLIVSRRSLLEKVKNKSKKDIVSKLSVGQDIKVKVKSILNYGCFCSYEGSIDMLLHLTRMAWSRVEDPSDLVSVGDEITVRIIDISEDMKVSVSLRDRTPDPWKTEIDKIKLNEIYDARVTRVTAYGAFLQLNNFPNFMGLVYKDKLTWFDNKNNNPSRVITKSEATKCKVIEINIPERKLGLSIKDCTESPWIKLKKDVPINSRVKIKITGITDFGVFGQIENSDCVLLVHKNELHFSNKGEDEIKKYRKGMTTTCVVQEIDVENQKIRGSIRLASGADPFSILAKHTEGDTVTCIVSSTASKNGVKFKVGDKNGFEVLIKKSDLSKNPEHQRFSRFIIGDRHDAKIVSLNKSERTCKLSIRALEEKEEKALLKKYSTTSSGGTLEAVLGPILKKKKKKKEK
ncbi:S1 RNA-binding domain-containing protein [Pelagibacteraceae bacterium]|nr:S1 RNA-binding domain-containing protein [Pelagibacteraceae bacterium]